MPQNCGKCRQNPGTAGPDPMNPQAHICVSCAAIETLTIAATPERRDMVPDLISNGPAWPITQDIRLPDSQDKSMWLHQAGALQELVHGNNVGVATATASGKSRIFQLWTLHQLMTDPDATALVFYPTKALANDQANSWNRRCADVGLPGKHRGPDKRRRPHEPEGRDNQHLPGDHHDPGRMSRLADPPGGDPLGPKVPEGTENDNHRRGPHLRVHLRKQLSVPLPPAHHGVYHRRQPQTAPVHRCDRHHPGTRHPPPPPDWPGVPGHRPHTERSPPFLQDPPSPTLLPQAVRPLIVPTDGRVGGQHNRQRPLRPGHRLPRLPPGHRAHCPEHRAPGHRHALPVRIPGGGPLRHRVPAQRREDTGGHNHLRTGAGNRHARPQLRDQP